MELSKLSVRKRPQWRLPKVAKTQLPERPLRKVPQWRLHHVAQRPPPLLVFLPRRRKLPRRGQSLLAQSGAAHAAQAIMGRIGMILRLASQLRIVSPSRRHSLRIRSCGVPARDVMVRHGSAPSHSSGPTPLERRGPLHGNGRDAPLHGDRAHAPLNTSAPLRGHGAHAALHGEGRDAPVHRSGEAPLHRSGGQDAPQDPPVHGNGGDAPLHTTAPPHRGRADAPLHGNRTDAPLQ